MSILKLLNAAKETGLNKSFYPIFFESLVSRARNAAVAHFLEDPENTHLLFIDSDIIFEPEDVFKLLQANKEVVAGIYPKKYIVWDRLKKNPEAERVDFPMGGTLTMTEDNLIELEYIDGYMSAGDNFYDLFKVGIRNGIYESEDWGFCSLWKGVGGKVLIHPDINVKHLGWHEYSGNLMKFIIEQMENK